MVVTSSYRTPWHIYLIFLASILISVSSQAAVLPEDQTEILYHRYQGGGITIDGPSVLVRKQYKDKVSAWGNYYTDSISGASIDLLSRGSTYYEEQRTETSLGADYLHERTMLSVSATNSSERDYEANSYAIGLSQDFFGDMSTLSLNYSQGNDEVRENIYVNGAIAETQDRGTARHQRFGFGLTQVMLRNWILSAKIESVIDDGFLNNPYRNYRAFNGESLATSGEIYPTTRNSDAFALRSMVYLPYRAAVRLEYRVYQDSWGIEASNYDIRYTHPFDEQWVLDVKFRAYEQTSANFYQDIFIALDSQNFHARDKELSTYSDFSFGLALSYKIEKGEFFFVDETILNIAWDHIVFDYDDFRENTPELTAEYGLGNEPLYGFSSDVLRLFATFKY